MKNKLLIFSLLLLPLILHSQLVIENPEDPSNPEAGRTLEIQEVLRITDEGGQFFFQYPRDIKVGPDGSIFIYDQEQLLRFDEKGKFIHNYFKKGQGPGELNFIRNYGFKDNKIVVLNTNPYKLVWFDFDGDLLDDVKIQESSGSLHFQFLKDDTLYFFKSDFPRTEGKPAVVDMPQVLITQDEKGQNEKELVSFNTRGYATGGAFAGISRLISLPYKRRYLFVSHTQEYLVKLYDTEAGKTLRSFTRKYKRVKPPEDYRPAGIYSSDGKRLGPPPPEYLDDINQFYTFKDRLWVRTSTKDEEKGYLIDVFDMDGVYTDSFYLDIDGSFVATHGDFIFTRERDENELIRVVKYKVLK